MFETPIATRPKSVNPADAHLTVVLHKNFKGEYVTHIHNSYDNGFHHGHYFGKELSDLDKAWKDFGERL